MSGFSVRPFNTVSTHSRLKAAVNKAIKATTGSNVSTHSRLKAAAKLVIQ